MCECCSQGSTVDIIVPQIKKGKEDTKGQAGAAHEPVAR